MTSRPIQGELRVQLLHPEPGKGAPCIFQEQYEAVRGAIMRAVGHQPRGVLFKDLPGKVASALPNHLRVSMGSVGWYTITVKLDLEARGLIERVPGARPQRLRRIP